MAKMNALIDLIASSRNSKLDHNLLPDFSTVADITIQEIRSKIIPSPSPIRCIWENSLLTAAFPDSTIFGDYRKWNHEEERSVDFVIAATMLVRRTVIETVGTFDSLFFMYSEETDWQMRIRAAGW